MINDYEGAIKAEINKREANKSETGLDWACDAFLQSELTRIKKPSEIKDLDERIHSIEDWIRSKENPLDPSEYIQLDKRGYPVGESNITADMALILALFAIVVGLAGFLV